MIGRRPLLYRMA